MQTETKAPYESEAETVADAIAKMAATPEALENFKLYLSYHFLENFTGELVAFSKIFDYSEDGKNAT